jgi:hypothetical protein
MHKKASSAPIRLIDDGLLDIEVEWQRNLTDEAYGIMPRRALLIACAST